jgi:uncharacterized membrane protein SpoIIM required for sporulation
MSWRRAMGSARSGLMSGRNAKRFRRSYVFGTIALLCIAFVISSFFRAPSTEEAMRASLKELGCRS